MSCLTCLGTFSPNHQGLSYLMGTILTNKQSSFLKSTPFNVFGGVLSDLTNKSKTFTLTTTDSTPQNTCKYPNDSGGNYIVSSPIISHYYTTNI